LRGNDTWGKAEDGKRKNAKEARNLRQDRRSTEVGGKVEIKGRRCALKEKWGSLLALDPTKGIGGEVTSSEENRAPLSGLCSSINGAEERERKKKGGETRKLHNQLKQEHSLEHLGRGGLRSRRDGMGKDTFPSEGSSEG